MPSGIVVGTGRLGHPRHVGVIFFDYGNGKPFVGVEFGNTTSNDKRTRTTRIVDPGTHPRSINWFEEGDAVSSIGIEVYTAIRFVSVAGKIIDGDGRKVKRHRSTFTKCLDESTIVSIGNVAIALPGNRPKKTFGDDRIADGNRGVGKQTGLFQNIAGIWPGKFSRRRASGHQIDDA